MTEPFSRKRRFGVAFLAIALGALLFRSQVAQALVVRGDEFAYRGERAQALDRYTRALHIDPNLSAAADRFVFLSMQVRDTSSLRAALDLANSYLARNPSDATVLSDRAMCYLVEQRYRSAQRDFERAARLQRSAQDYVFAGWAAEHARDSLRARMLWRRALQIDSRYKPAAMAMAEHPQ